MTENQQKKLSSTHRKQNINKITNKQQFRKDNSYRSLKEKNNYPIPRI